MNGDSTIGAGEGWHHLDADPPLALTRSECNPQPAKAPSKPSGVPVELTGRPEWQQRAACRGVGPDRFYSQDRRLQAEAKAMCARCTVVDDCLEAGRREPGVWGGMAEHTRKDWYADRNREEAA